MYNFLVEGDVEVALFYTYKPTFIQCANKKSSLLNKKTISLINEIFSFYKDQTQIRCLVCTTMN